MTRTNLDDAHWALLMLVIQRIPHAWKRDKAGLRRFITAVLWLLRTNTPWRDLPDSLSHCPSVYHRFRRWCMRCWWDRLFKHLRHHVENMFARLKDQARIALRRDKTQRSWTGFVHLDAIMINLRLEFSHRA